MASSRTDSCRLLCLLLLSLPLLAYAGEKKSSADLIHLLQNGGYVVYLRHGATDHDQSDEDLTDLRDCRQQRNLSQQGKDASRQLGRAFKWLDIKLDKIISSPYCRCVDTALHAFNRVQIDNNMRASFASNKADSDMLNSFLRVQLSQMPMPKHNTLLVGHTANLREVTAVWAKPEGVMHIFRPLGIRGFQHLGHIEPDEWNTVTD